MTGVEAPEPEKEITPGLVSVIIPTYQREKLIGQTLESVHAQTYTRLEVIIIDDGSTDGTKEFIESFAQRDNRIHYFYQANKGPAGARNKGIQLSRGEFIALLDSDELWMPRKIERQIEIFQTKPEVDFQYCSGYFIDENGVPDPHLTKLRQPAGLYSPEDFLFDRVRFFSTSGIMFRRKCLAKSGLFDESMTFLEDVDLWFRILLYHKGYFLNEELVANRTHPGNYAKTHSRHPSVDFFRSEWQMRRKAVGLFEQEVRMLTAKEKKTALDDCHLQLIKECLAYGFQSEARRESASYLKQHPGSFSAILCLMLSFLPGSLVSRIITMRRRQIETPQA